MGKRACLLETSDTSNDLMSQWAHSPYFQSSGIPRQLELTLGIHLSILSPQTVGDLRVKHQLFTSAILSASLFRVLSITTWYFLFPTRLPTTWLLRKLIICQSIPMVRTRRWGLDIWDSLLGLCTIGRLRLGWGCIDFLGVVTMCNCSEVMSSDMSYLWRDFDITVV